MSEVNHGPTGVSAHVDDFGKLSLPPIDQWPDMDWQTVPELAAYPSQMNCAIELLDKQTEKYGDRPVIHFEDSVWTYNDLLAKSNQIAHVLVDDLGIKPGNRVFMRAPNNPMYVAIWLAVMKVGAIGVATMPLLRDSRRPDSQAHPDRSHERCADRPANARVTGASGPWRVHCEFASHPLPEMCSS